VSNQLSYLQSLGFVQSPWSSVLFFLFAGTLYFIAPAVGYAESKRGILLASMWAMVIKLATSTFRECLVSIQLWYAPPAAAAWNVSPNAPGQPFGFVSTAQGVPSGLWGKFEEQLPALLTLGETVAFLAAVVLFVFGLQKLVRREVLAAGTLQSRGA
jgi:hypothetical protein